MGAGYNPGTRTYFRQGYLAVHSTADTERLQRMGSPTHAAGDSITPRPPGISGGRGALLYPDLARDSDLVRGGAGMAGSVGFGGLLVRDKHMLRQGASALSHHKTRYQQQNVHHHRNQQH